MISYLTHGEIDKAKWNLCIGQSVNSLVYGYAWYLDIIAPGWEALVYGDYEAVFPLTHGRKFSFRYLYQPFFTQQLGVFYKALVSKDVTAEMIRAIPPKYRLIDINLNEGNIIDAKGIKTVKGKNYVLNLDKPYTKLLKGFSEHAKRNVKKGKKNNLVIRNEDPDRVIDFYIRHKGVQTKNVHKKHYLMLRQLAAVMKEKNMLFSLGVYDKETMIAGGLYVSSPGRLIYLLGTASPQGRDLRAMYMMMDHIIFQFSEHPMLLDFEGSEVSSIARFFKGFGSAKSPYYRLRINRLPWIIRWIKE